MEMCKKEEAHAKKKVYASAAADVSLPNSKRTAAYTAKKEKLRCLVRKYTSLSLKEYLDILDSKMNDE